MIIAGVDCDGGSRPPPFDKRGAGIDDTEWARIAFRSERWQLVQALEGSSHGPNLGAT